MKRFLAVSLLWMSSLSIADVFLECEYNDPKIRNVDYIHLFEVIGIGLVAAVPNSPSPFFSSSKGV